MITVDELASVARLAMDKALALYLKQAPLSVRLKGDRDMVTDLDFEVERCLRQFLRERTPHLGILGEEDGRSGNSTSYWIIDPMDGTANFAREIPLHAISLALRIDGIVTLGIIAAPALGEVYFARHERGSYKNGKQMKAAETARLLDAIVSVGDFAVGENAHEKNVRRLALTEKLASTVQRVRMIGTASLDLAWVAEGRLDCSVMLSNKEWDTAAGSLIASEAGAVVMEVDGSPHGKKSTSTVAVAPALKEDMKELLGNV